MHRSGSWLSLARQAVSIGIDYGTHAIEALAWVAETVEESVYEAGSLVRSGPDLRFALDNPPLRVGAFRSVRVLVDRVPLPAERVELRAGPGTPWRSAASLTADAPLAFGPGERLEFRLVGGAPSTAEPLVIRLEFETSAIPPTVWLVIRDRPRAIAEAA